LEFDKIILSSASVLLAQPQTLPKKIGRSPKSKTENFQILLKEKSGSRKN